MTFLFQRSLAFVLLLALTLGGGVCPIAIAATQSSEDALREADQLISIERLDEALAVLKGIEDSSPKVGTKVDLLVGKIYMRLEKPAKALEIFEKVNFRTMDDAESYLGMAEASLALGRIAQARRHALTAIKSDPDLIAAELVVARADDMIGRVDKAKERLDKLIALRPENENVVVGYSRFLSDRDDPAKAVAMLVEYTDRHPMAAEANDRLGLLDWRLGDIKGAAMHRAIALKAFAEMGNEYRARAIAVWLDANIPLEAFAPPPEQTPAPVPMPAPIEQARPAPAPTEQAGPAPEAPAQPPASAPPARVPAPTVLARPEPLPIPDGVTLGQGSGFVVNGGANVVTNRHVIEGAKDVVIRSGTGEVRKARVVTIGDSDDLALLELDTPFPENYAIPFTAMIDPRPGRSAVIMGFPMASALGATSPALTEGVVSKITGLGEQPTIFQLTSKLNKGNSGGPIFDNRGNLIGVAVAKLDTTKYFEKSGYLPEDVNLGIKVSRVLALLRQRDMGDVPADTRRLDLEELYQAMLPSVVLIVSVLDNQ